ncbi:MAG: tetratricopeptide repeat protein [Bacteroidia bacterium]
MELFSNEKLFKKGIEHYNNQNYSEALIYFDSLTKSSFFSAEIFYNIGNCYYKQNELGKAILYYEKAKKLSPNDEDIIHNLNFCNRLIRDKAGKVHESPLNRLFFGNLSANTYAILSLIFFLIATIFIVIKLLLSINYKIRITIIISALLLALSFLSLAYFTNHYQTKERYAIIIPSKVNIHVEPKEESKVTFVLHEGSKIEILEVLEDWKKIKFGDGKIGWINASNIELI